MKKEIGDVEAEISKQHREQQSPSWSGVWQPAFWLEPLSAWQSVSMGQSEEEQIQRSVKLTGAQNYQESEKKLVYPHDVALQEQAYG